MSIDATASWSQEISLPMGPQSPSLARAFVCAQLQTHGLMYLADAVQLVVSELATNAVQHARTSLLVRMKGDGTTLLLTVSDHSSHFTPRTALPLEGETEGRGLLIVESFSDRWGVTSELRGAKSVWASFSLAPAGPC